MARRVVETKAKSIDHEPLIRVIIFEEGISKQDARKESIYCKRHSALVRTDKGYEFKN